MWILLSLLLINIIVVAGILYIVGACDSAPKFQILEDDKKDNIHPV